VALTRSLLVFSAGVAAGAAARAAYPKFKDKLDPVVSAALAGAGRGLSEAVAEVSRLAADRAGNLAAAAAASAAAAAATPPDGSAAATG
jgi:hypothetical protein